MNYRYDAFISYRHVEPDRKWARWLHRALETFRTPRALVAKGHPDRIRRVFRDEDELAASSDLSSEIEEALAQSRFLIVVCSPRTPESDWVNQEVVRFRELGRDDRVLALLIEGEPFEAFPKSLCEIRRSITDGSGDTQERIEQVEPLAADVRATQDTSSRDVRRMALLRCMAALLGCRFDDLRQRDHQRRQRRLIATVVAAMVLASLMAGLALFAFSQREIAEERALEAQRRLAQSLMAQGDAQAASYAYRDARSSYTEARKVLTALKSSTLDAELGLWDSLRRSPPPLVLIDQEQVTTDAAFLSDEQVLVASIVGLDLWNVRQNKLIRSVLPKEEVECFAISPDKTRIVTGGRRSQEAAVWELATGRELVRFEVGQPVLDVAFSADGKQVLTGGQHGLAVVWDAASGERGASVNHFPGLQALAWLPDGRVLTAGVPTRTAGAVSGEVGFEAFIGQINEATEALAEEALKLIREGGDIGEFEPQIELHRMLVWDMAGGTPSLELPGRGNANDVAVTTDGRLAIVAVDERVELWDLRRGDKLFVAEAGQETSGVAISPDGRRAISVGSAGLLIEWDLQNRRRFRTIDVDDLGHRGVSYGPNGRLALLNGEGPLAVVDLEQTPEARRFGGDPISIQDVAFSPDGRLAASATDQRVLVIWDVETGREVGTLAGHDHSISRLAFLPDGRRIITAGLDGIVRLWDLDQGKELAAFKSETALGRAEALAVSPSGRLVLTGHWNHQVVLWDVEEARELRAMQGFTVDPWSLAFVDEDWGVVGYGDGSVGVWDLATGHEKRSLFGGHWPYAVAARPDGCLLVGDSSNDVFYWDAMRGELLGRLTGHKDTVRAVAFLSSHIGVSVAEDGHLIFWDLDRQKPLRQLDLEPDEYDGRLTLGFGPGPRVLVGNSDADRDFVQVWDVSRATDHPARPTETSGLGSWYAARGFWSWAVRSWEEEGNSDPELLPIVQAGLLGPQGLTDGAGTSEEQDAALSSSYSYVKRLMDVVDRGRSASPEAFVLDGNELLENGDPSGALPYYERSLRTITHWLDTPEESDQDLAEYLADQRREALFGRSRAYIGLGDYSRASEDAMILVNEYPDDVRYRLLMAGIHEGVGAQDAAQFEIEEALRLAPDSREVYLWIANYHERQGDTTAALKSYDRAVEIEPDGVSYENRAAFKERIEQFQDAIADVSKAIELEESAFRYAWRAQLYGKSLAYPEAIADWDRVEAMDPGMLWFRYYRAQLRINMGDLDGAEADLDAASEAERNAPASLDLRGILLLHRKEWSEAEAILTKALAAAPDSVWSYYNRAYAREEQGDVVGALADLDLARELGGDQAEIINARGHVLLTLQDDPERALAEFDRAVLTDPGFAVAHLNRGACLRELGRLEESLQALNRAIQLDSDSPRSYYQRGLTLRALGRDAEARSDLEKYFELTPDAPEREELKSYIRMTD